MKRCPTLASIVLLLVLSLGCSPFHSEERAAIEHLESLGAAVVLTPEGKAREVVLESRPVVDDDMVHLAQLSELEELDLGGTDITDAGLVHLAGLTNLKKLDIGGGYMKPSKVSDAGLVHLQNLHNLEQLVLSDAQITDAGLVHLKDLKNLRSLYLFQTQVSDAGLTHLEGLTELQTLRAGRTRITPEGAQAFQAKMPNLTKFMEAEPEAAGVPAEPMEGEADSEGEPQSD
ncbi:leucine-rich repeat domain-containing protein [Candidatus Laterigemmans baculatus]|uniref:leucine-rich repeat domain-containing protein n=1 Tax=Candidatus Laterigemmans baculatus TaxID=2770505 RepID=UPI0013DADBBB|nr:hypothetical protein [Candidatus Laterigemmans baculatus]